MASLKNEARENEEKRENEKKKFKRKIFELEELPTNKEK